MNRFFETITALARYTANLDTLQLMCDGCQMVGQFVSHGFFYRQLSSQKKAIAGKRILCSTRGGRAGCGRSMRLYLAEWVPHLHYSGIHLTLFICTLLAGNDIATAYLQATSQADTRHAYRWLQRLQRQLPNYRNTLLKQPFTITPETHHPRNHRSCLFASLQDLLNGFATPACAHYQQYTQRAFL